MKKTCTPALLACLLFSGAHAQLVHTTASFYESEFCKKHGCDLINKEVIAPETINIVVYHYKIKLGKVTIERYNTDGSKGITRSGTILTKNTLTRIQFLKALTGKIYSAADIDFCIKAATRDYNNNLASVKSGEYLAIRPLDKFTSRSKEYEVECQMTEEGTTLTATDAVVFH